MRPLLLLGGVSIALGLFLLIRGVTRTEEVELGPIAATVETREPVSPWIGGGLVALGAVLVAAGARRRA